MTQEGKVISIEGNKARVEFIRNTACGHDCDSCSGGCGTKKPIYVLVENPVNAKVRSIVTVESKTSDVLGKAFLLYICPIIVWVLTYLILLPIVPEMTAALLGGLAFLLFLVGMMLYDKRLQKKMDLPVIVEIIKEQNIRP